MGRSLFLSVVVFLAGNATAHADNALLHLFSQRAVLRAADQICDVLDHDERRALAAGYWQARGTALRATQNIQTIANIDAHARNTARHTGCSNQYFVAMTQRLQNAFAAFSRTQYMDYPATHRTWRARRGIHHGWVASQSATAGDMFGLYRNKAKSLPRLAATSPEIKAIAARLWLPDSDDTPPVSDLLSARPRSMMRPYWASEQEDNVWIFPADASEAFASLDPRSVAVVELVGTDSASSLSWAVEVGDYRAAEAFSRIGPAHQRP